MAACAWGEKRLPSSEAENMPLPTITDEQLATLRDAARLSSATPLRELAFDAAPAWTAGVSLEGVYVPRDLPLEERRAIIERKHAEEQEWGEMLQRVEHLESELVSFQNGDPAQAPGVGLSVVGRGAGAAGSQGAGPAPPEPLRAPRPATAMGLQRRSGSHGAPSRPPLDLE